MDWIAYKDEAARLAFEKDALHVYAAVVIQIAAAIVSRRTLGDLLPWLAVLMVECGNEIFDYIFSGEDELRPWQVVAGFHDLVNTMILPTVLLLLCRHRPQLFACHRLRPPARPSLGCKPKQSEVTQATKIDLP